MRHARVSRLIPALLLLTACGLTACGPFKQKPLEGDPIREEDVTTAASEVYEVDEQEPDEVAAEPPVAAETAP